MKVVFYIATADESDVYEFPDNTSEIELQDAANQWVCDNVRGYYDVIDEDDDCSDCESYECYKNGIHSMCPKEEVWDYCKKADDEWNEGWK